MSAMTAVQEYRDLGESWPKAIRSAIEFKGRLGWVLRDVGWAILHAGDKVLGDEPTSLDAEFRQGVEYAAAVR